MIDLKIMKLKFRSAIWCEGFFAHTTQTRANP